MERARGNGSIHWTSHAHDAADDTESEMQPGVGDDFAHSLVKVAVIAGLVDVRYSYAGLRQPQQVEQRLVP